MADKNYKDVFSKVNIESQYIFCTLRGSDLLPFCHLPFRPIVLPVDLSNNSYRIVTKESASSSGHSNLYQWLQNVEKIWQEKRKEKSKYEYISKT